MTLKADAKFKAKLTCELKNDISDLVDSHTSCRKPENGTLMGSFCPKYIKIQMKKYRSVISYDTEEWRKG